MNVNLAPVADVAGADSALAQQDRTFGRSPSTVGTLALAFADGLGQGRVAATAKHFPGFGAAAASTDVQPITIGRSVGALRRTDLPPFAQLIKGGVPLVMLSTATYPALDQRPAALSPTVTRGLLRDQLGFGGVTVTDDLETPALTRYGPAAALAPAAAGAGDDLLIFAKTYGAGEAGAQAIAAGITDGRLNRSEARAAASRVMRLRAMLGSGG